MVYHRLIILLAAFLCCLPWSQRVAAAPGSVEFFVNNAGTGNYDYIDQTNIPLGFGEGEFTLEIWIKPNGSFPVGPIVDGGVSQRQNWASEDNAPYNNARWWWTGNFLLDGHNNNANREGTFTLQFYGGGRVRWLFGDGSLAIPDGGVWSVGAYPASSTPTLLDGVWHQLTFVRRWSGQTNAQLELWIDGVLVATEISDVRANMRQWWTNWPGFPSGQEGWFWGSEKQAAIGFISQYEDYKGLIDELRFWSRAKSGAEIAAGYADPVTGTEPGLVGNYAFGEAQGNSVCDSIDPGRCMFIQVSYPGVWSAENAPIAVAGDTTPPTVPTNLQATVQSSSQIDLAWNASTDNIGVSRYDVRRNGSVIANTANPSFSDTGLTPGTSYSYSVSARDAAGNSSMPSASVTRTTFSATDTESPTTPTNLQGTALSASQISLTWTISTDNVSVTGYTVRRDSINVGTTNNARYDDSGLAANTRYVYAIVANDGAGNQSAPSATVSVTTSANSVAASGGGGGAFGIPGLIILTLVYAHKRRNHSAVSVRAWGFRLEQHAKNSQ